ncbi:aquaporin Z [Microlunatus antarcticus]|uniref:Aquaporin Z n=1 Tax=Microlunatus antarcticus TaxID=53388 RepID=A0A7W5JTR5_9ACTN|nr:aquaporin Z [Microlunatus antarcticus]MBB3326199.1 aquaporin Z [Microlunatus antarcticus]
MPAVPAPPSDVRLRGRLGAEFLGTFGLVFGGCGSAVLAAKFLTEDGVQLGIGFAGVALAFGLTVLTGAFAFGHVSGGHFNPAVTVGLAVARRFGWREVPHYVVTQVVAATAAGGVLWIIATGGPTTAGELRASGFATNGYGAHSPGGYGLGAALLTEIVMTAAFLYVILGATDDRTNKAFAPIAIGLALTLIHLISIPVTNTSVNPARSLGVAWYVGGAALGQVWLFVLAPLVGAALAGATYARVTGADRGAPSVEIADDDEEPAQRAPRRG